MQDGKVGNGSQINITYHLLAGFDAGCTTRTSSRFGWDFRRLQTTSNPIDIAGANGQYVFLRAQTALPTNLSRYRPRLREPAARFAGLRRTVLRLPSLIYNIRYGYHAAFFQDNWKVNSRLTLNLGMRYDLPINWHDLNGDYSGVDLNAQSGGEQSSWCDGVLRQRSRENGEKRPYATDFSNFGPRFGFSFRLRIRLLSAADGVFSIRLSAMVVAAAVLGSRTRSC